MQVKWLLKALGGLIALSVAMPVLAFEMSVPNGWYGEANVGSSHLSNSNLPGHPSSSGIGYNGNIGYKFMPYLGVELGYTHYADSKVRSNDGTTAASVSHYSYDVAARGILPISDSGVEGFAKVGAQRINSHTSVDNPEQAATINVENGSHSSTGLYLGLGGQFYVMPELAIVGQWQRAQGSSSTGTEDLYSVGISFIFD